MEIKAITFDYFGTLIDVDKGGIVGIERVLKAAHIQTSRTLEEVYLDWDIKNVRIYRGGKYRPYRDTTKDALTACLEELAPGVSPHLNFPDLTDLFLSSLVEDSPPHDDVPEVLDWMSKKYPLMPITNMDSSLWQRTQLTQYFEHVTTAEMAKAYKPSADIFNLALSRLGVPAEHVLHCSLAAWADIDGAKPLGMNVAWINRGQDELGVWQPRPDFEYQNLTGVSQLLST